MTNQYVVHYRILYSSNGHAWDVYQENDKDKVSIDGEIEKGEISVCRGGGIRVQCNSENSIFLLFYFRKIGCE